MHFYNIIKFQPICIIFADFGEGAGSPVLKMSRKPSRNMFKPSHKKMSLTKVISKTFNKMIFKPELRHSIIDIVSKM